MAIHSTVDKDSLDKLFLPNFCDVRMVLASVVIAELLALVLALAPNGSADRWGDLSLISLFIQWIALSSAALLCLSRPLLSKLGNAPVAAISYVLLLTITGLLSEAVYWLFQAEAFNLGLSEAWHRDFLLRNLAISAIVSAVVLRYFYVQHQWKRNIESETMARIQALQSRIRPHFLFNSMNIIASLTRSQPLVAEATVHNLADLFRASLSDARNQVPLHQELELCHKYLDIENLRLGERLNVVWQLGNIPKDALLPALTIQPLLENAIYHGIEPLSEGGTITITGHYAKGIAHITIANPVAQNGASSRSQGNNMALDNIRQRMQAYYGAHGKVSIESASAHNQWHYSIHLSFPHLAHEHANTDRG